MKRIRNFFRVVPLVLLAPGPALADSMTNSPISTVIPNASASVEGSGVPGIDGGHWFIWNGPASFDGTQTFHVGRSVGTTPGNSAPATGGNYQTLLVESTNGSYNIGGEWTGLFAQHNLTHENGVSGSVALNGTIYKDAPTNTVATTGASGTGSAATVTFSGGATIPVGHSVLVAGVTPSGYNGAYKVTASSAGSVSYANTTTGAQTGAGTIVDITTSASFASNFNCIDENGEADPVGLCVGNETNVTLNAASGSTDVDRRRIMMQLIAHNMGGTGGHVGRGLLLGNGEGVTTDRGVEFEGAYQIGMDFTGASYSGVPILLGGGQPIGLDGSSADGSYSHSFRYGAGTVCASGGFQFFSKDFSADVACIDNAGSVYSSGIVSATAGLTTSGTLSVGGVASMQALNAASLAASSSTTTGAVIVAGGLGVGGAGNFGGSVSGSSLATSGWVTTPLIVSNGAKPTNSGSCAINTQVGGATAGGFKANGACSAGTIVLTFAASAPNGWSCTASDLTTPADAIKQTGYTAGTATFVATMAAGDLATFGCMAF